MILAGVLFPCLLAASYRSVWTSLKAGAQAVAGHVRAAGPLHFAALAVICGAGFFARWHLWGVPMRYDESYTAYAYASLPLHRSLTLYDVPNNHVFHTLLVHLSFLTLGASNRAIRLPAFAAGVLCPPAAYVATLRLANRHAALVAAALVAASAQLIEYSSQARGYTIDTLAALVVLALAPSLARSTRFAPFILFAFVAGVGFYTVPVFLYPLLPVVGALVVGGVCFGYTRVPRGWFLVVVVAVSAMSVAWAVLAYGLIAKAVLSNALGEGQSSHEGAFGRELWSLWTLGYGRVLTIVLVAGFALSAGSFWRRSTRRFPLGAMVVVLGVGAVTLHHVVQFTRVWLPILALALVCASIGYLDSSVARRLFERRSYDAALSVLAAALAAVLVTVVTTRGLDQEESSPLPSASAIAASVAPSIQSPQIVLSSTQGWAELAWAFKALHSRAIVAGTIGAENTPNTQTTDMYVVVNHRENETLASVLSTYAPASGLKPSAGKKIASFPGADVFLFHPA